MAAHELFAWFSFLLYKCLFSPTACGCSIEFQSRTVLAQNVEEESFLELFWKTLWLRQPVSSLVSGAEC